MRYLIGGERFDPGSATILGTGGEGTVYGWRGRAVKIFHPLVAGLPAKENAAQMTALAAKIAKIRAFPAPLPGCVAAPMDLVRTDAGEIAGFVMNAITGGTEALRLGQRRWREGRIANAGVVDIMKDAHATLRALHARGVVVGDLNDANILVSPKNTAHFIDCDSMQFGTHRCMVGHERFLDPRLYGVDLQARQAFSDASDWYAFTVMLFTSLLYVHPYGGQHPTLRTQLRRAEARHSVLRSDIVYPKAASHFRILPDALLEWCRGMFDLDRRGIFPGSLLEFRWTTCSCGAEHARNQCPECTVTTQVPRIIERHRGHATKVTLFETKGRILFATMQGGLKYLYEESSVVCREDGSRVGPYDASQPGFAICGATTWFATEHGMASACRGAQTASTMSDSFHGERIFDANARFTFRLENGWLSEATTGMRVGQVLEGQTWFRVGEELGFGFYRAGRLTFPFLFRPGESGIRHLTLDPIDGHLVDVRALFDGERVLLLTAVELGGRRVHTMQLIGPDGAVLARASGSPEDQAMLASIHGKCMAHGRVLAATDGGLLLIKPDLATRTFVEERIFTDTDAFLTAESELLAGPQGSVYVIDRKEISQLTIHGKDRS
jgi:hypothetical protein